MRTRVWASFTLLTVVWGASFLWIKIAVLEIGPYTLVALRLALAVVGLLPFVVIKRPPIPRDRGTWVSIVMIGVLNAAVPWLLIAFAELTIDSAVATVLNSTVPLFTILFAHFLVHDDRITVGRVAGLMTGFAGVVALSFRDAAGGHDAGATQGHAHLIGQGAMLLAATSYGLSSVYARRKLRHVTALTQAFYSLLVGTVSMWIVLPFVEPSITMPSAVASWVGVVWLGVLGGGVAYFLFYFLLHAIGPTRSSLVTYTIQVVGVALGVIVLKEQLDLYLVLGTILILSGVWVVNRR
jgi:drug/metabolite transporter (DMT)-like permease